MPPKKWQTSFRFSKFMGFTSVAARHHVEREATHFSHNGAAVVPNGAERIVSDQPRDELWASIADLSVASSSGLRLGSRLSRSAFKALRGQWAGSGTPLGNISARWALMRGCLPVGSGGDLLSKSSQCRLMFSSLR